MDDSRGFLKAYVRVVAVFAGLIAVFNGVIDPFGLFVAPTLEGVNAAKPRIQGYIRMVKAHQLVRVRPRGLILGSSRAENGLDPDHPGWLPEHRPVYNAALPSARIYEAYHYLRHAQAQNRLRQVVLGVDEFMFDDHFPYEPGFALDRLDPQPRRWPNPARIKDYLTALWSYDALSASIDTWLHQGRPAPAYLANGSQDSRRRRELVLSKGGHHAAFEAAITASLQSRDGLAKVSYGGRDGGEGEALKWFDALVRFCGEERIDLYVFISPVHAQWLEALWKLGKWEAYERWKRDLVRIVEAQAARAPATARLELWDFSGFTAITQETVPPAGDSATEMRWYWEASHYKRATGKLVLDRMLGSKASADLPEFGVRLTSANLRSHLSGIRQQLARYEREQPGAVEFVSRAITRIMPGQTESASR